MSESKMPPTHPAAAELPLLYGAEFDSFAADIAVNGLRHPIVMLDGQILDGRNRWRACESAGIEPRTVEWDGKGSPISFVMSENLHRRHMDIGQRALVGARLLPMLEEEGRERMREGGRRKGSPNLGNPVDARGKAAEIVGVSHGSIDAAVEVLRDAPPAVLAAVEEGRMAVSAAVKKTRAANEPALPDDIAEAARGLRQVRALILSAAKEWDSIRVDSQKVQRAMGPLSNGGDLRELAASYEAAAKKLTGKGKKK